ncbi:polysaccharide deacetylase family protein [Dactylosporangium sp. NPDC049525]|uniref:polysaccharide deacetylase family protein n=1 Tax=Dactylosporangium sp. NPDC049525 TaxID=3154730 RepID=UPI00342F6619
MTGLSRRRLLGAGLAATGTALAAGGSAGPRPRLPADVPVAVTRPAAAPTTSPPAPTPAATALPQLDRPVFTLEEYRRLVPGPPFPGNAVALTIDDGPHPTWTPKVLRLLDRYHVPALFCLIGNQVLGHETVARDIVAAGHHVANHTWSHPGKIDHFAQDRVQQEIDRAQNKIYDTTGKLPTIFRSPGGAVSPAVFAAAAQARMVPINWTNDPRDWTRPGTGSITHRMLAAHPGQILLCHDGGGDRGQTCAALETVIPALQARGYQFVALDGLPSSH